MDYIDVWHIYNPWGDNVSHTYLQVNRSKVKVTRVIRIFAIGAGGILTDHWSTIFG